MGGPVLSAMSQVSRVSNNPVLCLSAMSQVSRPLLTDALGHGLTCPLLCHCQAQALLLPSSVKQAQYCACMMMGPLCRLLCHKCVGYQTSPVLCLKQDRVVILLHCQQHILPGELRLAPHAPSPTTPFNYHHCYC